MKKTCYVLFALLLTCSLLFASNGFQVDFSQKSDAEMELNFELNDYSIDSVIKGNVTYSKIKFDGSVSTNEKGFAELPFVNANIQLPPDRNVDVKVISSDFKDYQLDFPLLPSRGTIYRNQNPDEIPYEIAPESIVDKWYPGDVASASSPFIFRDVRGTNVLVHAFQYNSEKQVLRVYEKVQIAVVHNDEIPVNPIENIRTKVEPTMMDMYETLFINYNTDRDWSHSVGEIGEILVLYTSSNGGLSTIQPWIDWKKEMGYTVTAQSVSSGTNVKSTISSAYTSNSNILYVQLVGDWAHIKSDTGPDSAPTDPMLGCVVGSDYYPELIIGRFSAESSTEVTTQINKAINYEKLSNTSATWMKRGLGIGSEQGDGSGDDGEADYAHVDVIKDYKLVPTTYNQVDEAYQYPSDSDVANSINNGISVINYCGHGSETSFVTSGFNNSDIAGLSNGDMLPIIFSVACVNGKFHQSGNCFAEAWLEKQNGGAVATVMSTINQPWQPPMRGQDYFNDLLTGGYNYSSGSGSGTSTTEGRTTFGSIIVNGFALMYAEVGSPSSGDDLETIQTWTIFGDASLQVRTDTPKTISLSNESVLLGTSFSTTVSAGGSPIENAKVCISQGNTYLSGVTNSSGQVTISTSGLVAGTAKLTVTGFNLATKYEDVTIGSGSGPFVAIDSYTISAGGDSDIDFGETVYLTVTLTNNGPDDATNVSMSISESDSYVSLNDSNESFGTIAAGASVTRTNAFRWTMGNNPDEHDFTINTNITCSEDSWSPTMNFTAYAPILAFGSVTINDATGGNGNGKLDPGETATITISLQNNGNAASSSGSATMACSATGISVTDGNDTFSAINNGSSDDLSFSLSVDSSVAPGSEITLNFNAAAGTYSASTSDTQAVGLIVIGEGTSTGQHLPVEAYYGYTYSQSIYLQSEINVANSELSKIYYYFHGTQTFSDAVKIYMGHTTKTSFSSTSDWISTSNLTLVYDGTLNVNTTDGWIEIALDTPFAYNNTNNLVIAVDENTSGYHASDDEFYCSSVSGNRSIYYYNDSTNPDPASPPTAMGTPAYIPNLKLVFQTGSGNPADIAVNPTSFSKSLAPDATTTDQLTISNTGDATLSYTAEVQFASKNRFEDRAYCSASGGNDEYISNVTIGSINKTSTASGYADYTSESTDMEIGSNYSISITNGNPYSSDQCGIWVDWNQDEDFEDANETIVVSGTPGDGPYTATIIPPSGAIAGSTRMRIRITYTGAVDPCGTTQYGEVEDYTINVIGETPSMNWLTLNSNSSVAGSVNSGSNNAITVGFDATDLVEDTYTATIVVTSNDPDESPLNIPVSLIVSGGGEPEFVLNPTSLSFGSVTVNESSTKSFTISNTGTELLSGTITTPYDQYVVTATSKDDRENILLRKKTLQQSKDKTRGSINYNVSAGGSQTFDIVFTPTAVTTYNGNITITSNDSDEPTNYLSLTGSGSEIPTPEFVLTPTSLSYGNITVNNSSTLSFTISNTGSATLSGNISTPFTQYYVSEQSKGIANGKDRKYESQRNSISYTINSGVSKVFDLTFTPTSVTSYNGNVTITSNDSDEQTNYLSVTGSGVAAPAPEIDYTPSSFSVTMDSNESDTRILTIDNSGNADLTYTATVDYGSKYRDVILSEDFVNGNLPSGWQMTTNSSVGWHITSDGSSQYWTIPSGSGYYACSNDDEANDDGSLDYLITPQMNFSGYDSATLTFMSYFTAQYSETAHVKVSTDGTNWTEVGSVTSGTVWQEIEIDLSAYVGYSQVWINFHANDNGAWASGWAIDNVLVSGESSGTNPEWLTLNSGTTVSGTITSSGSADNISVGFDTSDLDEDTYTANIAITSNDADESSFDIPVTLTVSATSNPTFSINVSSINFGDVTVNTTSSETFTITNSGTGTLSGEITTPNSVYVVSSSSKRLLRNTIQYDIDAGLNETFNLAFTPVSAINYDGTLSISSNDAAHSSNSVSVTGSGAALPSPDINVTPLTINASMQTDETDSQSFTIQNSGDSGSELTYSIVWNYNSAKNLVTTKEKDLPSHVEERLYKIGVREETWLSVSPTSGSCLYNETDAISVDFNSAGLSAGDYSATITISNNAGSDQIVSVNLEVAGSGLPINPRAIAEFEPMEGVLVRYPFGIPMSLIAEMSEDVVVTTIVANSSEQSTVQSQYSSNGVNLSNCNFIYAPSDSYWTRDFGPWYIQHGSSSPEVGIVDPAYNRPRPNDDAIPSEMASFLGEDVFDLIVEHTGGNYMVDGMGVCASTNLVLTENTSMTQTQIEQEMENLLGITNYQLMDDPNGDYIEHIDCWGKFLDVDKILIRSVPSSHSQYDELEAVVNYYEAQTSSYGTPYEIYRVYTSYNEPYTNSLILNDKVLVPQMGTSNDAAAISAYQAAMPGYEVIGITNNTSNPWESTDALHCRTRGIADRNMIHIAHIPTSGIVPEGQNYPIEAEIIAFSGSNLSSGYPRVYYRVNSGSWNYTGMTLQSGNTYQAVIPQQAAGSSIEYYIYAEDNSGEKRNHPFIGAADAHSFEVDGTTLPPELDVSVSSIVRNAAPEETCSEIFEISNVGSGSINYAISLNQPAKDRSIEGSFLQCSETGFTPGETYTWTLTVYNGSTDSEWLKDVDLTFPTGVIVNSSTNFVGGSNTMTSNGNTGNGISINWHGEDSSGWGVIHGGETATATVNVSINSDFSGDLTLDYLISGDVYGAEPHTLTDTITLTNDGPQLTWISVTPSTGDVASSETDQITVNFDATGLSAGTYSCEIIISDNRNVTTIPVDLHVVETTNYPAWEPVTYATDRVMIYAEITIDGISANAGDIVAAMVGTECRGTAAVQEDGRATFVQMEISLSQDGETVDFDVYDASSDQVYNGDYTTSPNCGETIGDPDNLVPINAITETYSPESVGRMIQNGYIVLYWEPMPYAIGYNVYSSDNPYTGFDLDQTGTLGTSERGITWTAPINGASQRFYYITVIY